MPLKFSIVGRSSRSRWATAFNVVTNSKSVVRKGSDVLFIVDWYLCNNELLIVLLSPGFLLAKAMPTTEAPNDVGTVYAYDFTVRETLGQDIQCPLVISVVAVCRYHHGCIGNIEIRVRCR